MFFAVHHNITDPKKWEEAGQKLQPVLESGKFPTGIRPLFYLPSTDGRRADCVWEANSLDSLKQFLNPFIAGASKDEYFQINMEMAMGIPEHAPQHMAAHH